MLTSLEEFASLHLQNQKRGPWHNHLPVSSFENPTTAIRLQSCSRLLKLAHGIEEVYLKNLFHCPVLSPNHVIFLFFF